MPGLLNVSPGTIRYHPGCQHQWVQLATLLVHLAWRDTGSWIRDSAGRQLCHTCTGGHWVCDCNTCLSMLVKWGIVIFFNSHLHITYFYSFEKIQLNENGIFKFLHISFYENLQLTSPVIYRCMNLICKVVFTGNITLISGRNYLKKTY